MEKLLRVIKRKPDCVLVQMLRSGLYKVIDIEQDTICITKELYFAEKQFENYDLNKVRIERANAFEKWLSEVGE